MEKLITILSHKWTTVFWCPLMLFLAWPPLGIGFTAMLAFVPLLLKARETEKRNHYFFITYLSLFLFNLLTTWWVKNASLGGAIFMLLANTLLMCIPFMAFRYTLKQYSMGRSLMAFVFYWLGFEYFHFNWDISYPWLTLGNAFAMIPSAIQWYEYTGVLGGSLWILLVNVGLVLWLSGAQNKRIPIPVLLLVGLPLMSSFFLYWSYSDPSEAAVVRTSIIQPNVDPYEKFSPNGEIAQVKKFIEIAEEKGDSTSSLYLLPETAIVEYLDEEWSHDFESIQLLTNWLAGHKKAYLLTGASTYKFYSPDQKPSLTARKSSGGKWYDSYNTAFMMNKEGVKEIYHKSKLVPGVEKMPYPSFFKFLEPLAIDMGGITGSLGQSPEAMVQTALNDQVKLAPLICYESIYGEYVTEFTRKGANVLAIITNDGWWGNTPGYKQHLHYARLRAIENRRYIARSANTGISALINARGDIVKRTKWWEEDVINADVKLLQSSTIYSRLGDYIGRFALFLGIFFFLGTWVKRKVG
jgi:apolipoprotein N-acyltransferase